MNVRCGTADRVQVGDPEPGLVDEAGIEVERLPCSDSFFVVVVVTVVRKGVVCVNATGAVATPLLKSMTG